MWTPGRPHEAGTEQGRKASGTMMRAEKVVSVKKSLDSAMVEDGRSLILLETMETTLKVSRTPFVGRDCNYNCCDVYHGTSKQWTQLLVSAKVENQSDLQLQLVVVLEQQVVNMFVAEAHPISVTSTKAMVMATR